MNKFIIIFLSVITTQISINSVVALPPPEDLPEEILRTQIILEGRSPINGEALTPTEYAQLEAELEQGKYPPEIAAKLRKLIFLLQIRQMILLLKPF